MPRSGVLTLVGVIGLCPSRLGKTLNLHSIPGDSISLHSAGARFSKLPVITGPIKLFCFPFQMGVSKALNIIQ